MQLVRLGDGDVLLLGVDHEDRIRRPVQPAQATKVPIELLELALVRERLLLRHRGEVTGGACRLELDELADAARNRLEVGQHASEPALVDIGHAARDRELRHGILGLLLRADEEDHPAPGNEIPHVGVGGVHPLQGLIEVDDIDAVALAEDEALHLRVPTTSLMAEVHSGLEQLLHRDDSHAILLPTVESIPAPRPEGRPRACQDVL